MGGATTTFTYVDYSDPLCMVPERFRSWLQKNHSVSAQFIDRLNHLVGLSHIQNSVEYQNARFAFQVEFEDTYTATVIDLVLNYAETNGWRK